MQAPSRTLALGVMALIALPGCSGGAGSDLSPTLTALATEVIYPTYSELATTTGTLNSAIDTLCDTPNATTLTQAQDAWRQARIPWKRSAALDFGPAEDERLEGSIGWYPIDGEGIEGIIASDTALSVDYIQNFLSTTRRGLSAVEYLIFDDDGSGQIALSALETDPRRCELLQAYGSAIAQESAEVQALWGEAGAGGYSDHFAQAGVDTTVYFYSQNALDHIFNQLIQSTETLADRAFAVPLGLKAGTAPNPEDVESHRSDNGIAEALDILLGIEAVLEGAGGSGLYQVIASRSPGLEATLATSIAQCRAAIEAIPGPMDEAILSDAASVEAAFNATKDLQSLLKVDVAGALGVVVTFSDNDGD